MLHWATRIKGLLWTQPARPHLRQMHRLEGEFKEVEHLTWGQPRKRADLQLAAPEERAEERQGTSHQQLIIGPSLREGRTCYRYTLRGRQSPLTRM